MSKENTSPAAWNVCPSCNELTDLPDFEQPGTPLTCTNCGTRLVAECFGHSDDTEWRLILASEYYDDDES